jgi:hypothetical protein
MKKGKRIMGTATREVPLQEHKSITKDDVLRLIIARDIKPLFLRPHLDIGQLWAFMAGWIGDRGGGKSAGCAVTGIVDHMLSGKKVFSNMNIGMDIEVDNEMAINEGLNSGGIVHYQSEKLDKDALLSLDERYRKACLVIEEINVEYSNVRRIMANTNVDFNQVAQQLRHFETSLLYNVINEMFIDPQLRSLTDAFIKTYDTAFDIESLNNCKPRGIDFKWTITPMTGYLVGEQGKFSNTHRSLPPVYFHFEPWQGVYNSLQNQEKGIYSLSTKEKNKRFIAKISAESSPELLDTLDQTKFVRELALKLKSEGRDELDRGELLSEAGRPLTSTEKEWLAAYGIYWDNNRQKYVVNSFTLDPAPRRR